MVHKQLLKKKRRPKKIWLDTIRNNSDLRVDCLKLRGMKRDDSGS